MGATVNTGAVEATVTSTSFKNTASVAISSSIANNSEVTIGTVPAGKVWRVLTAFLQVNIGLDALSQGVGKLRLNGVSAIVSAISSSASLVNSEAIALTWDYAACPVLTAGQTATVVSEAVNLRALGGISYVEENA